MHVRIRPALFAAFALAVSTLFASTPSTLATVAHFHRTIVAVSANQSNNWSGYNQGTLEKGNKLFTAITGDWTVPTATAHRKGQAEFSSTWIGIGGGCVDAGCNVTDNTLIQLGTEQDVNAKGVASYSAWWELIPAPSVTISGFRVGAGDHMHATLSEGAPGVWTMTLKDLTRGGSFSQTVPYSSTHATAEWIEETPLIISSNGSTGLSALPNLGTVKFDLAQTNGANAKLVKTEEIQLVDSNNHRLATPSAPDADTDGFNDCTYQSTCAAPTSSSRR